MKLNTHAVHLLPESAEICSTITSCAGFSHKWGVYKVLGKAHNFEEVHIRDYETHEEARAAVEDFGNLTAQLAASIMDCIAAGEIRRGRRRAWKDKPYCWSETRDQMYADIAQMAEQTAEAWLRLKIEGIIYEVSEGIADACLEQRRPLSEKEIDAFMATMVELVWY